MASQEKRVPEVRFRGFSDDWEQRKLGEVTKVITKGTTPKDKTGEGDINFIKVENIDSASGAISVTSKISKKEHEGYLKRSQLALRDILFSIAGTLGRVTIVNDDVLPANTNQALAIIRLDDGNVDFLSTYLKGKSVEDYIRKNPTVGAQPNLSLRQVGNLTIYFPNNREQEKLSTFFKQLDETIALHQEKLNRLKQLKKGYLQEMFPQKGEDVPRIRFADFDSRWEQRKLGDISNKIGSGKTPKGGDKNYKSVGIPLLRSQNIFNNKVNFKDVVYITPEIDEDMANSRVQKDDILLNITGASIGRSAVYELNHKANVNQHVSIIRPFSEFNPYFVQLNIASEKGQKQIELNQAGGGREGLNFQQISKMSFYFPSLEEQEKYGHFFIQLDNIISLHQSKIKKLQSLKNIYLQKMFI